MRSFYLVSDEEKPRLWGVAGKVINDLDCLILRFQQVAPAL